MTSTAGGSGPTLVRAERQLGAVSGVGAVRVAAGERPTAADERAAAAQAWLAVARACTAQGADDEAYAAARSGLEELGDAYAGAAVEDDTPLKLAAAEDAHVHGLPHASGRRPRRPGCRAGRRRPPSGRAARTGTSRTSSTGAPPA